MHILKIIMRKLIAQAILVLLVLLVSASSAFPDVRMDALLSMNKFCIRMELDCPKELSQNPYFLNSTDNKIYEFELKENESEPLRMFEGITAIGYHSDLKDIVFYVSKDLAHLRKPQKNDNNDAIGLHSMPDPKA